MTDSPTDNPTETPAAPAPTPTTTTPPGQGETALGGLGTPAESAPTPQIGVRILRDPKPADSHGWWWGTGRRKSAVARVRMRSAKSDGAKFVMQITKKKFKTVEEYFSEDRDRIDCYAPLKATNTLDKFEVYVRAHGGGTMGQAQAVRLGVARALRDYDPTFEDTLREHGFLTRDARRVERKKYGQPGARKRFQFSKR